MILLIWPSNAVCVFQVEFVAVGTSAVCACIFIDMAPTLVTIAAMANNNPMLLFIM